MQPKDIQIDQRGDELRLTWRWHNLAGYILLGAGGLLVAYLVILCVRMWETIVSEPLTVPFIIMVGLLALAMLYIGVATLVNSTTVLATAGMICVRHGPLPYRKNMDVQVSRIARLDAASYKIPGRRRATIAYSVDAVVDGERVRLAGSLDSAETATYITKSISDYIGLA